MGVDEDFWVGGSIVVGFNVEVTRQTDIKFRFPFICPHNCEVRGGGRKGCRLSSARIKYKKRERC